MAMRSLDNFDFTKELPQISAPTLIIVGAEDALNPPSESELLHRLIPNSELIIVENCGHNAPIERPQEINRITLEFLSKIKH